MPAHKKAVTRDSILQIRTFEELTQRVDALVLAFSRPSRASLIEYFLLRAVEEAEGALGIFGEAVETPLLKEPLPRFENLAPRVQKEMLAKYKKAGMLYKLREKDAAAKV